MAYSQVNIAPIANFGTPVNMITMLDTVLEFLPDRNIKGENKRRDLADQRPYKMVPFKLVAGSSTYFPDMVPLKVVWAAISAADAELMRGWQKAQTPLLVWDREKLICYHASMQFNPNPWTMNKNERGKTFNFALDISNAVYYGDDGDFNNPFPGFPYTYEFGAYAFIPGWP